VKFTHLTITFTVLVFLVYASLIISLFYFFDARHFLQALLSKRTLFAVKLSIFAATLATFLSLFFAIPAAYALSRSRFFCSTFIDTVLELPMIISPVALGALLLIFLNTPVGLSLQAKGVQIAFTVSGVVLAQFVSTLGVATRLLKAAMDEIPTIYEDAAKTLGASPLRAFITVTLPLSKRGIMSAAILTWAKALGEFGATVTVAGSMAMKTETLPIAIFMRLASADIEGAAVLVLILISAGLGILYGARALTKKAIYM